MDVMGGGAGPPFDNKEDYFPLQRQRRGPPKGPDLVD